MFQTNYDPVSADILTDARKYLTAIGLSRNDSDAILKMALCRLSFKRRGNGMDFYEWVRRYAERRKDARKTS